MFKKGHAKNTERLKIGHNENIKHKTKITENNCNDFIAQ